MWMKYFFGATLPLSMLFVVLVGQHMESHKHITKLVTLPMLGGNFYAGNLLWELSLMYVHKIRKTEVCLRVVGHTMVWAALAMIVQLLTIAGQMRAAWQSEDSIYAKLKPPPFNQRML